MSKLPRLIDWSKLEKLRSGMTKQASTENPEIQTKEHPVTDSFGKTHDPKEGFSGPHLNANGMAYYVKDGRKWCPYQNAFMDEKKAGAGEIIKAARTMPSYISEIRRNPNILRNFCSHYGYEGEPLACIRAAYSSTNPALRKFAQLAAIDIEERAMLKRAGNEAMMERIIGMDDKVPVVKEKVKNFVNSAIGRAEEKVLADVLDIMISDAKKTDDKMLIGILDEISHLGDENPKMADMYFQVMNDNDVSNLVDLVSDKWIDERGVVKSLGSAKFEPESYSGEFAEPGVVGSISGGENISRLTENQFGRVSIDADSLKEKAVKSSDHPDFLKEAKKKKKSKSGESVPTNPALWRRALAWAKSKYDVCPSAYCNGAAAKRYKKLGGGWRKKSKSKK